METDFMKGPTMFQAARDIKDDIVLAAALKCADSLGEPAGVREVLDALGVEQQVRALRAS